MCPKFSGRILTTVPNVFRGMQEKQDAVQASERRNQVGGGYRSEKIRTYRFREGLAVDHRAGVSEARLAAVLDGDLDEMIDALTAADQAEKLKGGGDG